MYIFVAKQKNMPMIRNRVMSVKTQKQKQVWTSW